MVFLKKEIEWDRVIYPSQHKTCYSPSLHPLHISYLLFFKKFQFFFCHP